MDPLLSELFKQGILGVVIAGLVYAIMLLRAEHAEREKLWKSIFDEQAKENNALQQENIAALKEGIRVHMELTAALHGVEAAIKAQCRGGAECGSMARPS